MSIRVIVCGGRAYSNRDELFSQLSRIHRLRGISLVIHGSASGADRLAGEWALNSGVETMPCPADWSLGKKAGPIRNSHMLSLKPDGVIAFPGGAGTKDMISKAIKAGLPVMVIE